MSKWLWMILVIVLGIVTIVNIGPLILLGLSLTIGYYLFKQWFKTESTSGKVWIFIAGIIMLSIAIANSYALVGLAAGYGLYLLFKKKDEVYTSSDKDDFLSSFEKEWQDLQKY